MNSSLLKGDLLGLKDRLESLEKEFEVKLKDVEVKEDKFKKLDNQLDEFLSNKDAVIVLNIGGKKYQTKLSTLLSVKDTVFYSLLTRFISNNEETPKELFFDRNYSLFGYILDYLRTKKFNIKQFSRWEREDMITELEFYGLADVLQLGKKNAIDIGWDQGLSKVGMCTVNSNDNRNIRIHTTTCYTYFQTNKLFSQENFVIEMETTVSQTDQYYYIGIINESFSTTGSCMCGNPVNSYYVQCNGSIHINGTIHNDTRLAWNSQKVTIGIRVMLLEKQIFFYIPDKGEVGPYSISSGTNFRVVAGHCNTGNGEITITDCYSVI
jgi:hypothetical protein